MKRFEYRVERIEFEKGKSRDEQILALLNELGKEGWRATSLEVEPRLAFNESGFKALLEREVES